MQKQKLSRKYEVAYCLNLETAIFLYEKRLVSVLTDGKYVQLGKEVQP